MVINSKILDFASDGIQFDAQVVKSKAVYAMPYSPSYVHDIFKNKKDLGNDLVIEPEKYKINEIQNINKIFMTQFNKEKNEQRKLVELSKIDDNENDEHERAVVCPPQPAHKFTVRFKPKEAVFFEQKLSASETQLAIEGSTEQHNLHSKKETSKREHSKSLNNLYEVGPQDDFFLTELKESSEKTAPTQKKEAAIVDENVSPNSKRKGEYGVLKQLENIDWDENLINQLSEGTARYVAMKRVTDRNSNFCFQSCLRMARFLFSFKTILWLILDFWSSIKSQQTLIKAFNN